MTREISNELWRDHGEIDWLITSERIAGREGSEEMISVWWPTLAGVDIDLKRERIVLNGVNGWTGTLTGPAVAPIAVAAIAMCHGVDALLVHPVLAELRPTDGWQVRPDTRPRSAGATATILRMPRVH